MRLRKCPVEGQVFHDTSKCSGCPVLGIVVAFRVYGTCARRILVCPLLLAGVRGSGGGVLNLMGGGTRGRAGAVSEREGSRKRDLAPPQRSDPALRVIQRQGQFRSNGLVKNWCKWFRKMKIAQNL